MLDLFTGAFAVLAAPDGGSWAGAAGTAKASLGVELDIHHIGVELHDPEETPTGSRASA